MRKSLSESDTARSPSGQFDTVSKRLIQQNPEDWIRFTLGIPEAKVIEILDTEQPTVRGHRADSFIHVDILGKEAIMHFEFQTRDSTQLPMPYRVVGYAGRGIETFKNQSIRMLSICIQMQDAMTRGNTSKTCRGMRLLSNTR